MKTSRSSTATLLLLVLPVVAVQSGCTSLFGCPPDEYGHWNVSVSMTVPIDQACPAPEDVDPMDLSPWYAEGDGVDSFVGREIHDVPVTFCWYQPRVVYTSRTDECDESEDHTKEELLAGLTDGWHFGSQFVCHEGRYLLVLALEADVVTAEEAAMAQPAECPKVVTSEEVFEDYNVWSPDDAPNNADLSFGLVESNFEPALAECIYSKRAYGVINECSCQVGYGCS